MSNNCIGRGRAQCGIIYSFKQLLNFGKQESQFFGVSIHVERNAKPNSAVDNTTKKLWQVA